MSESAVETPEVAPVRAGEALDMKALTTWLRPRLAAELPGADGPIEILQFPNGSANLTYLLRVGSHELVLRRGERPAGLARVDERQLQLT